MAKELLTMIFWGLITFLLLIDKKITIEYAYIGMSIMYAAWLLYKEE